MDEARIQESDVIHHITSDFPAAFIADGNTATFPDQARSLHERLDEQGVPNAINVPSVGHAGARHGYMAAPGDWTDEYNTKKFAFLNTVIPSARHAS